MPVVLPTAESWLAWKYRGVFAPMLAAKAHKTPAAPARVEAALQG